MLNLIFTVLSELARRRYVTAKEFQGKFMEYPILFSLGVKKKMRKAAANYLKK